MKTKESIIDDWRDVKGYEGKYQVNYQGIVRSLHNKNGKIKIMTPFYKNKGDKRVRFVVKLSNNGKHKDVSLITIVANAFLGPPKDGQVPYHINGCMSDNYVSNIAYITRKELGKKMGPKAARKPVVKINQQGEIVDFYPSASVCARENYMGVNTIVYRCNGKRKSAFAPDGYAYAWEDDANSMKNAIRKIELELPTMHKAPQIEYQW